MSSALPPAVEEPSYPWLYTAVDLFTQCLMFMVLAVTFGAEILIARPAGNGDAAVVVSTVEREQRRLQRTITGAGIEGAVTLRRDGERLALLLSDAVLFASGQATVQPAARTLLGTVGRALAGGRFKQLRVTGHTDDTPVRGGTFRSNWELSAARAIAVLNELRGAGVEAARLAAAGYGEYRPRYPNNSTPNRAANRRVEVTLVFE